MDSWDLQTKLARTAQRYGMDLSYPLAMVSGGPDSVALLRALAGTGTSPVVLHVDHGLRGEESRGDAEFVRRLCGELGLGFELREPELPEGPGLQARARDERYALAAELARKTGATAIATGHTADDVAETVLMNLARGSGVRGLSGIPPTRGEIVRPLIEARRAEILAYLESLGQPYRNDPTNALPKYARNRVRLESMPVLEELYPGAGANIARAAALLRQDLEALEALAWQAVHRRGDELLVPPSTQLHHALQRHAVRLAHSSLAPAAQPLEHAPVESVLALERGDGTRTLDLPGGVVAAMRGSGELAIYLRREPPEDSAVEVRPGELRLAGWSIRVRELEALERLPEDALRPEIVYLDAGLGPYTLRLAREGDVVRPLGLGGGKKVLRAMMDRKVPKDLRRRTPVVADPRQRIAWVAGGELGEEFAVGEETRRVLRLEAREPGEAAAKNANENLV